MSKFKVGDKVRITGNSNASCNKIGDVGKVVEVGVLDDIRVKVEGRDEIGNWTLQCEAELVHVVRVAQEHNGLYTRILEAMLTDEQIETAKRIAGRL